MRRFILLHVINRSCGGDGLTSWDKESDWMAENLNFKTDSSWCFKDVKEVYYNYEGFYAEFWSSTEVNSEFANNAEAYKLHLVSLTEAALLNGTFKEFGLSVRCVKD